MYSPINDSSRTSFSRLRGRGHGRVDLARLQKILQDALDLIDDDIDGGNVEQFADDFDL